MTPVKLDGGDVSTQQVSLTSFSQTKLMSIEHQDSNKDIEPPDGFNKLKVYVLYAFLLAEHIVTASSTD